MEKRRLLKYIASLMVFMFLANSLILKFSWYYSISWIDMLMHFLGGVWLSWFFLYVFYDKKAGRGRFLAVILGVIIIGVLWELFEYFLNVLSTDAWNRDDTLSDIFFDLAGGGLAYLYFTKVIMLSRSNRVQSNEHAQ